MYLKVKNFYLLSLGIWISVTVSLVIEVCSWWSKNYGSEKRSRLASCLCMILLKLSRWAPLYLIVSAEIDVVHWYTRYSSSENLLFQFMNLGSSCIYNNIIHTVASVHLLMGFDWLCCCSFIYLFFSPCFLGLNWWLLYYISTLDFHSASFLLIYFLMLLS